MNSQTQKIGLITATSYVIGGMIGAGIFVIPAILAPYGSISFLGWLFTAAGALILAKIFGNFSKIIKDKSGGPYAYSKAGFGNFIGFLVAWGYWISIWVSNAALAITVIGALSFFFPVLESDSVIRVLSGLSIVWFLTWINARGIKDSGKFQVITTILKLLPLFFVIIAGLFLFDINNFPAFNLTGESDFPVIPIVAAATLYAFLGLESASVPAADIKNPDKNIPKATFFGTMIVALVYILSTFVLFGVLPMDVLASSPSPFADAARLIGGDFGGYFVAGGIVISAIGCLNVGVLFTGQIPMAASQDQLFPKIFGKQNKNGAPVFGLIIGGLLTTAIMLMNLSDGLVDQFKFIANIVVFSNLIPYLFVSAAYVLVLIERKIQVKNWIKVLTLSLLGIAYSLWAIYGAGEESALFGLLLLLLGIPVFVIMQWNKREK
ncbi:amino acid permease [Algibacter marinivivus]|uniref:Arginine/agmatine antiporter n=1 Tax=Algibacter marinivivus TaxID=2100723 RepID=A0A2U2X700_9FLAO|nr:amino acid permease [Algibacter marinivivus]PWH83575.1 amino acid permease [Algibacter marinivivus]